METKNTETKKQEAIRLAYGDYFEKCNPSENGWTEIRPIYKKDENWYDAFDLDVKDTTKCFMYRPKSLQGIENNNGWISIESEEDLPKEKIYVYLIDKIKGFDEKPYPFNPNIDACKKELLRNSSHYQPTQKPKNPIF